MKSHKQLMTVEIQRISLSIDELPNWLSNTKLLVLKIYTYEQHLNELIRLYLYVYSYICEEFGNIGKVRSKIEKGEFQNIYSL